MESSRRDTSIGAVIHFISLFLTNVPHYWMHLIESSSTKVSSPSEVPLLINKLYFSMRSQAGMLVLDNCANQVLTRQLVQTKLVQDKKNQEIIKNL